MQNGFSTLHQQFQQKQKQLTQVSNKIHDFISNYKRKLKEDRSVILQKMDSTRQQLKQIKSDFSHMKTDIQVYRNIPNSFVSLILQLPQIYENIWENREQKLIRNLQIKEEECRLLKNKLAEQQSDSHEIRLEVQNTQDKVIDEQQKKQIFDVFEKQETDSYIDHMQIKDDDDKISKELSQQEDQNSLKVLKQRNYMKDLNSERFCSIKSYESSLQFAQNGLHKKTSISNIFSHRYKSQSKGSTSFAPEPNEQKRKFEGHMSKSIKNKKKSSSQNKQNHRSTQLLQLNSRLFGTESQILGSRMNDFRRMLLSRNKNLKEI